LLDRINQEYMFLAIQPYADKANDWLIRQVFSVGNTETGACNVSQESAISAKPSRA